MAIPAKKSRKLEIKDNNRLQSLTEKGVNTISNTNKGINKNVSKKFNAARLDVSPAQKLRDMELLKKLGCSELETQSSFSGKHSESVSLEQSKNLAINVIGKIKSRNNVTNTETTHSVDTDVSKEIAFTQKVLNGNNKIESNITINKNVGCLSKDYSQIMVENKISSNNCTVNIKGIDKSLNPTYEKNMRHPMLLHGLNTIIDLNKPITAKQKDTAKLNAIEFVKKNGIIKKSDPNKIRGDSKKRMLEDIEKTESVSKKSKLADSEFISDRFKKMMETTSKHLDLLECRDDEEKEKYFKKLEIKEKMEEKMIGTHKVSCKAVQCLKCKYTSFSASDLCKDEKHPLKVFDSTKRFYECGDCGNRTVTLKIIPTEPCKNCGSGKWQKSGMMKDRSVLTHSLSIRGEEQKFLNSVVTDSSINLLVPDND